MTASEVSRCIVELLELLLPEIWFTIEAAFPHQISVKAFLKKAFRIINLEI
jgi:hypothetical protein